MFKLLMLNQKGFPILIGLYDFDMILIRLELHLVSLKFTESVTWKIATDSFPFKF